MNETCRDEDVLQGTVRHAPLERCRIYYMSAGQELHWAWSSEGGERKSAELFPFFYDCVEDARRNGYYVDLERLPQNLTAAQSVARAPDPALSR